MDENSEDTYYDEYLIACDSSDNIRIYAGFERRVYPSENYSEVVYDEYGGIEWNNLGETDANTTAYHDDLFGHQSYYHNYCMAVVDLK